MRAARPSDHDEGRRHRAAAHGARAEIYQARRDAEFSLMAKGIYAGAANESKAVIGDE